MPQYYVYILTDERYGTLYTGVTSDLVGRVYQHKKGVVAGFTKTYNVHCLVYYEVLDDIREAITREKQIKKWRRAWKIRLIKETNPDRDDLYEQLI